MLCAFSAPVIYDGATFHYNATLWIDGHEVVEVSQATNRHADMQQTFSSGMLVPGFIDLQVNGGGGVLFNNTPTLEGLKQIIKAHHALGTHGLLPTLITADDTLILQAIDAVSQGVDQNLAGLLGLHLEGPMINPERRGIHYAAFIHTLSDKMLARLGQKDLGSVLITLAPECVDGNIISELTAAGITVFAGHTKASEAQLMRAIEAGLTGVTHLYNAMPPMESRMPGIVAAAINDPHIYCTIINDGIHVAPTMVEIAMKAKPKDKMILVTDAMATTGSALTEFSFNQQQIYLQNNRLVNHEGRLAGAHLSLFQALQNTLKLGISTSEAINMASLNPATCLGRAAQLGHLTKGAWANINHWDGASLTPVPL